MRPCIVKNKVAKGLRPSSVKSAATTTDVAETQGAHAAPSADLFAPRDWCDTAWVQLRKQVILLLLHPSPLLGQVLPALAVPVLLNSKRRLAQVDREAPAACGAPHGRPPARALREHGALARRPTIGGRRAMPLILRAACPEPRRRA